MRTALTINHVAYEDAGTLAMELAEAGFHSSIVDACTADLRKIDPLSPDLLIVLGGAIGVYERDAYPFVDDEIALIRAQLAAKRPTLGICLGAQLMAAALAPKSIPARKAKRSAGRRSKRARTRRYIQPSCVCWLKADISSIGMATPSSCRLTRAISPRRRDTQIKPSPLRIMRLVCNSIRK